MHYLRTACDGETRSAFAVLSEIVLYLHADLRPGAVTHKFKSHPWAVRPSLQRLSSGFSLCLLLVEDDRMVWQSVARYSSGARDEV